MTEVMGLFLSSQEGEVDADEYMTLRYLPHSSEDRNLILSDILTRSRKYKNRNEYIME